MSFHFKHWSIIQSEKAENVDNPLIFIGCMTGMSADKHADFTLAIFDDSGMPIAYQNVAEVIPEALREKLARLSRGHPDTITINERATVEAEFTEFLVAAFITVIRKAGLSDYPKQNIILSPHGQAINHQPLADPPFTDILLNGDWLAERTGYAVVSRHRQMPLVVSMAAPLAPVLIRKLFYSKEKNIVLLNGGGIANICTLLKDAPNNIIAYDTGPANGPIDALIQHILDTAIDCIPNELLNAIQQKQCDVDGQLAASGKAIPELMNNLLQHEYFKRNIKTKSADRADFDLPWILQYTQNDDRYADIITTVSEVVAKTIADSIINATEGASAEIITYGGLAHNKHIMQRIQHYLNQSGEFTFVPMHEHHYDPNFFEALLMAYLGYCAYNHIAVDLNYCAREGCKIPAAIPGSIANPTSSLLGQ